MPNVHDDDVETLQFAEESPDEHEVEVDPVDAAREQFAQYALDHDRDTPEADFVRWLVAERETLLGKVRMVSAFADKYARDASSLLQRGDVFKGDVAAALRRLLAD